MNIMPEEIAVSFLFIANLQLHDRCNGVPHTDYPKFLFSSDFNIKSRDYSYKRSTIINVTKVEVKLSNYVLLKFV